jgi:hypothetical protein
MIDSAFVEQSIDIFYELFRLRAVYDLHGDPFYVPVDDLSTISGINRVISPFPSQRW